MCCIGTIKHLKYGYFGIQAVFITPRPSLFPSAPPLEINLGSGQWKLPISLITILKLYNYNNAYLSKLNCIMHIIFILFHDVRSTTFNIQKLSEIIKRYLTQPTSV